MSGGGFEEGLTLTKFDELQMQPVFLLFSREAERGVGQAAKAREPYQIPRGLGYRLNGSANGPLTNADC